MTLALRDGAGIEVIKGDQAIGHVALAGSLLFGLCIQEREDLNQPAPARLE